MLLVRAGHGVHVLYTVGIAQAIDQLVADHDPAWPEGHEPCGRGDQGMLTSSYTCSTATLSPTLANSTVCPAS